MKMIKKQAFGGLAGILALLLSACGGETMTPDPNSTPAGSAGPTNSTAYRLQRGLEAELLPSIKAQLLAQYGQVRPVPYQPASPVATTAEAADAANAPASGDSGSPASSTNTQEIGVDEADRLKSEGAFLYAAAFDKPTIRVFAADAQATKLAELSLTGAQHTGPLSGFYLHNQTLTALSSPYHYGIYPMPLAADVAHVGAAATETEVFTLDVSSPQMPEQTRRLTLGGELVSSRMIGGKLYLATRQAVTLAGMAYPTTQAQAAANQAKINASQLADFLPDFAVDGVRQGEIFTADDCFKAPYTQNNALSIVSVLVIDTANAASQPKGQCFLGDIETLYASPAALYLATTRYPYITDAQGGSVYSGAVYTDLHRFAFADDSVNYSGSGQVSGHLGWYQDLKPFRLSEHNDTLRVITYTGDAVSTSGASPASLFNLQTNVASGELEVIAQLPNSQRPAALGKPGEQIYATRFVGDRGYLVTYRLTDPLYILDLSDPRDPFIVSELAIDGYSDYLHPVGEHLLLGVGKDAVADTTADTTFPTAEPAATAGIAAAVEVARGAWYQGVKLSLIDVSNPQQPFERQKLVLGKRGSNTPVSASHHAFTSLLRGNNLRVAIPLSRHETVRTSSEHYNPTLPQYHYAWTQDELLRFSIDITTGTLLQLPALVAERADSEAGHYTGSRYGAEDRSVLMGDRVYYLHGDEILTMPW